MIFPILLGGNPICLILPGGLVNCPCGSWQEALKAAQEAVKNSTFAPKLLAITVLTSLDASQLASDLKIPLPPPEYALHNALMAKECGLDGVVVSPKRLDG